MIKDADPMGALDRTQLLFAQSAREAFWFLNSEGFTEVEALPTLVRYRKNDVEVDIYHGRRSFEVGCGITKSGARYAFSEIVRAGDPDLAKRYRNPVATTPDGLVAGLHELGRLVQRFGAAALGGEPRFFSMLEEQRKLWAQEYSLDVLADQLRPQAEDAFRRGEYSKAAELYGRIRERLSPAEIKKLALANRRGQSH